MESLKINLFKKSSKKDKNGLVPIYLKMFYGGTVTTLNSGFKVDEQRWDKTSQLFKTRIKEEVKIRAQLNEVIQELEEICLKLKGRGAPFGAESIKKVFQKKDVHLLEDEIMLSELFDKHYETFEPLVKIGIRAKETLRKYETLRNHVYEFLKFKMKIHDVALKRLNYAFIESFDLFLRRDKGIGNNTTVKYVQSFRSLMNVAVKYDWLVKDPFLLYDKKVKVKDAVFLTELELKAIEDLKLYTERLNVVRDIFVFAAYSGYSPVDIQKLTWDNIIIGNDKQKWIITKRQKTGVQSDVPLLPQAERIIEKYKQHPQCIESGTLLPPKSTQKMNEYLKEIAEKAGIIKNLHLYVARHTFACTVILANGLSIEVLSKMMGHSNLKQTLHYGKIQNARVSEEMKMLKEKLKRK